MLSVHQDHAAGIQQQLTSMVALSFVVRADNKRRMRRTLRRLKGSDFGVCCQEKHTSISALDIRRVAIRQDSIDPGFSDRYSANVPDKEGTGFDSLFLLSGERPRLDDAFFSSCLRSSPWRALAGIPSGMPGMGSKPVCQPCLVSATLPILIARCWRVC